jgi:hypothetical protein
MLQNFIPDDGPVRSETNRSLIFFKFYCELKDNFLHLLVIIAEIFEIITFSKCTILNYPRTNATL